MKEIYSGGIFACYYKPVASQLNLANLNPQRPEPKEYRKELRTNTSIAKKMWFGRHTLDSA